jgi:hypothetical protein
MTEQHREDGDRRRGLAEGSGADSDRGGSARSPLSAIAIFLVATIILGIAGGWFLRPQSEPGAPAMTLVAPEEIPQALTTLNGAAQQTAQVDSRQCRFPMASIIVVTPGNPAGGTVSFRTSKYQSPSFHVTDKPQRIAIPSPLPETGGVDLFSADGDAKGLLVSLYPTVRMEPVNGTSTVKVFWRPRPPCKS